MGQHGKHRSLVRAICAGAAFAVLGAGPVVAQCRLALVLALDISSSVDAAEDALQRAGLAAALRAPEVVDAILADPSAPIALAVYEWSGRYQQDMVLNWTLLNSVPAIDNAAAAIAGSKRSYAEFPTAAGYGIGYAASVFDAAPSCLFHTLDVSGDGVNNDGFTPEQAYANFPLDDVTVNGLAIGGATPDDQDVFDFYLDQVAKGPGSFVETADDFQDFARAMRRKLLREVEMRILGAVQDGGPSEG